MDLIKNVFRIHVSVALVATSEYAPTHSSSPSFYLITSKINKMEAIFDNALYNNCLIFILYLYIVLRLVIFVTYIMTFSESELAKH